MKGKGLHMVTFTLLVIGGLNWLLFTFGWDLGSWMSTDWWMTVTKIVYVLVGLSAIYELVMHKSNCKRCGSNMSQGQM